MQSNDNVWGDCPKAVIKPSLHFVTTETITSKILKTSKRDDCNSQSMPFRVPFRQSIPRSQSTDLMECCVQPIEPSVGHHLNPSNYPNLIGLSNGDGINTNMPFLQTKPSMARNTRLYNSSPSSPVKRIASQPDLSYCPSKPNDVSFHGTHGSDVLLTRDQSIATRREGLQTDSNCYVFVDHIFSPANDIIIEIKSLDQIDGKQSLIFGVTDVSPSAIDGQTLPTDPNLLVSRRDELWLMVDNFCDHCRLNDRIRFSIDSKGFVSFSVNSGQNCILFPTQIRDQQSSQLWPFFDIIGRIKSIKIISKGDSICFDKESVKRNLFNIKSVKHLYKCLNCLSNYANTAFVRCGHKYYCYVCAQLLAASAKKCPICHNPIFDLLVVFP